jgi:ferredoxin like protein
VEGDVVIERQGSAEASSAMPSKLPDKLFLDAYKADTRPHIRIVSDSTCLEECHDKPCTTFCPADVYQWTGDHIAVGWENCIECGGCRIGCPFDNIDCGFPRAGFGVRYRY